MCGPLWVESSEKSLTKSLTSLLVKEWLTIHSKSLIIGERMVGKEQQLIMIHLHEMCLSLLLRLGKRKHVYILNIYY